MWKTLCSERIWNRFGSLRRKGDAKQIKALFLSDPDLPYDSHFQTVCVSMALNIQYLCAAGWGRASDLKTFQVILKTKTLFFWTVSGSQQDWKDGTEISHIPPVSTHSLPITSIPHQSGVFVIMDEPSLTHHNCLKSAVYLWVPWWGLDKCVMTRIWHYSVTEYYHCPKRPLCSASCLVLFLSPSLNEIFIWAEQVHLVRSQKQKQASATQIWKPLVLTRFSMALWLEHTRVGQKGVYVTCKGWWTRSGRQVEVCN